MLIGNDAGFINPAYGLVILTARSSERTAYARTWLDQHGLADYFEDIISVSGSKSQKAAELGAQMLVDDDLRHVSFVTTIGVMPILFASVGLPPDGVCNPVRMFM
jgi:hypothetical protein